MCLTSQNYICIVKSLFDFQVKLNHLGMWYGASGILSVYFLFSFEFRISLIRWMQKRVEIIIWLSD